MDFFYFFIFIFLLPLVLHPVRGVGWTPWVGHPGVLVPGWGAWDGVGVWMVEGPALVSGS